VQPPLMHGDDVIMVQRWLNMTGSEIDGVYGPKTQKAVRTYQAKHGLDVDGIVGRKTWDSLAR
jgi:peptidoglycan hydrolase-like protein with peptidoglycan-binding domain